MAKTFKDKRVSFPSGEQRAFLRHFERYLTISEMARLANCSERTIRDWRREKFSMSLAAVRALSARTRISMPKGARIVDAYAHIARASKMGLAAVIKKYGGIPRNEKYRNEQWRLWWGKAGKFEKNPLFEARVIHKPKRNVELAEFVGIMMGDGGISEYQVVITLHHVDDLEYAGFVVKLIKKLFKVESSVYHSPKQSVNDIVVSRKELVNYLHELGLPIGNKVRQRFDIPKWIKQNEKFATACIRGLVDTDGSLFTHRYRVKGSWYAYKKLSFTSASEPLRKSVYVILQRLGFHPRIADTDVRLDRMADMERYFSVIGSHNPKHLRRYGSAVG
jgi:LAGLIDADG-like domain